MPKKNFKDNTDAIDRFFSETQPVSPEAAAHDVHEAHRVSVSRNRINLRLRPDYKKHLERESWKAHKSITEYLNDLIKADMDGKCTLNNFAPHEADESDV